MYQKVSFSGFFITSIAISIAILFLFDYSPLFAANFNDKSGNGSPARIDDADDFKKSLHAALRAAMRNASAAQALEAKNHHHSESPSSLTLVDDIVYDDDRQARDRIQLWATPSTLEREKLNRTESGVAIQVEDPLATKREPKWHNACTKRSALNDTLIKIIIGMQSPHPTLAIEEDRKASGTFIKMENGRPTILATSQRRKLLRPIRPKRGVKKAGATLSLLEQQQELNQTQLERQQQLFKLQPKLTVDKEDKDDDDDDDDGDGDANDRSLAAALEFERNRQAESNQNKQAQLIGPLSSFRQPRKNSIYLSSSERRAFAKHIVKRSREMSSKSRKYLDNNSFALISSSSSKSSPTNQAMAAVLGRIGANATHQLTKVMDKIFVSDVRISWSINCALNNAHSAKKMLGSLMRVMGSEIENNNKSVKPDEEQIKRLVENRREWLANFTDLEVKNDKSQIGVVETRNLLANVSHYLQFVAVALEQMLYEQAIWDRQLSVSYHDLERATLKMLCEIDTLCQLLRTLKEGKEELVRLMEINKLTDENLRAFESMRKINASSVESIGKRIFYSKDLLDSVYFNWLAKHKPELLQHQQLLLRTELTSEQHQNDLNSTSSNSELQLPITKQANATWLSSSDLTNNFVSPSTIRIGRLVMPIRERILKTYSERLVRDKSMFENYEKVLTFYETILTNVFV